MKKIIKILFICLLFLLIHIEIYAFSPSSNKIYNGIDVSAWQNGIDFNKVKNGGIKIVYLKASEGTTYRDSYFERNYQKAKENGLYVGTYHYVRAKNEEEAIEEAEFFASIISGKEIDCKLAMDFESFGNLSKTEINNIAITFLETLRRITKQEVMVYSNTYTAKNIFNGEITKYPLWIAEYGVSNPSANGKWETWVGFQYTDTGTVAGIKGYVDKDKFTKEVFMSDKIDPPEDCDEEWNGNNNEINIENLVEITVKRGDTLSQIAINYNTTVQKLVELNEINNKNLIYVGQKLLVPVVDENNEENVENEEYIESYQSYYIKKGDTLSQIALNYKTTVNKIVSLNNINNPNLIFIGQKLIIPKISYSGNYKLYTIKRGDTLYSISRRYNTTIANLVRINRIQNPNLIYAGRTIKID